MNSNLPKFTSKNRFIILLSCVVILLSALFIYQSFALNQNNVVDFETFSQINADQKVKTVVVKVDPKFGEVTAYDIRLNYNNEYYQLVSAEPGQRFTDGLKIVWNLEGAKFAMAKNPNAIDLGTNSSDIIKINFMESKPGGELKLSIDLKESLIYAKNKGVIYP